MSDLPCERVLKQGTDSIQDNININIYIYNIIFLIYIYNILDLQLVYL